MIIDSGWRLLTGFVRELSKSRKTRFCPCAVRFLSQFTSSYVCGSELSKHQPCFFLVHTTQKATGSSKDYPFKMSLLNNSVHSDPNGSTREESNTRVNPGNKDRSVELFLGCSSNSSWRSTDETGRYFCPVLKERQVRKSDWVNEDESSQSDGCHVLNTKHGSNRLAQIVMSHTHKKAHPCPTAYHDDCRLDLIRG